MSFPGIPPTEAIIGHIGHISFMTNDFFSPHVTTHLSETTTLMPFFGLSDIAGHTSTL